VQLLLEWTNEALMERLLHPLLVIGVFCRAPSCDPSISGRQRKDCRAFLTTLLLLRAGTVMFRTLR